MIDMGKLADLLAGNLGTYHTTPDIYESQTRLLHKLHEEIGKLNRVYAEYDIDEINSAQPKIMDVLRIQYADIIIVTTELANASGINIDSALVDKLQKNFLSGKVLISPDQIVGDNNLIPKSDNPCEFHRQMYENGLFYCYNCGKLLADMFE